MIEILIPGSEVYDEAIEEFRIVKPATLRLEHSLVSISKWESKWKKPFLVRGSKTREETVDYFRCMTLTQNVSQDLYACIPPEEEMRILEYMNENLSATTFREVPGTPPNLQIVTSEVIYFQMASYGIPFDPCQKWHLSRLMALLRIAKLENSPKKKMPMSDVMSRNAAINAARKKALNSRG